MYPSALGRWLINALFTIMRRNNLISFFNFLGVLDKNQYGATQFSLVHAFFELYGGEYSGKLQSAFSKLFTNFLHTEGFTLGVRDILVTEDANHERRMIMEETRTIGNIEQRALPVMFNLTLNCL